jgi:hypothetical protein
METKGNLLGREKLLERQIPQVEKVEFENGDFVYVRQMTGRERDLFEQSLRKEIKNKKGVVESYEVVLDDFRAKLAVCTVSDKEGNTIFQPKDYSLLSQNMLAANLEKIVNAAQKLNAITEEDKEALVKNFVAGQTGSSNSDSAKS